MKKRVYICSPYQGDVEKNVAIARAMCLRAIEEGFAPFAPHLVYPQLMDDSKPEDREIGMECAMSFISACNELWVCANVSPSAGMREEMVFARETKIHVRLIHVRNKEQNEPLDKTI